MSRAPLASLAFPERTWPGHDQPLIGILPGEGSGPELIGVCLRVLEQLGAELGLRFRLETGGAIGREAEAASGSSLTPEVLAFCRRILGHQGAILCGPGGGRFVYDLRRELDLFCKLTPLQPFEALRDAGPLRPEAVRAVDVVLVRENNGGMYFGDWSRTRDGASHGFTYRRHQVRRLLGVAARLAAGRRGRLTLTVKTDGLPAMSELWLEELSALEGALTTEVLEIDNAAYQLIQDARRFDVVVSPNLFGDIIADTGALLLGSRGMSFSGNFGPADEGVFQTGHGAAYDLAGQDQANPLGQLSSLAMLLREHFDLRFAADRVESAIASTLRGGYRTADIMAPGCRLVGTQEMGARILEALGETETLRSVS